MPESGEHEFRGTCVRELLFNNYLIIYAADAVLKEISTVPRAFEMRGRSNELSDELRAGLSGSQSERDYCSAETSRFSCTNANRNRYACA